MAEKVFNLFLIIENDIIVEIGGKFHKRDGSDEEKLSFLQSKIEDDIKSARRFKVPDKYISVVKNNTKNAISYDCYMEMVETGEYLDFFEEVFKSFFAPQNPIMCITPIIDGRPKINGYQIDRTIIHN